ncbi:ATP-NAD kinase-like domain-containing protein [Entophlyctis helioformis]|nr:ATP-NAD kinase-like domain-containing protein [Entophlyctis helioformis]
MRITSATLLPATRRLSTLPSLRTLPERVGFEFVTASRRAPEPPQPSAAAPPASLNAAASSGAWGERRLVWTSAPPRNILVIKKPDDVKTDGALRTLLRWFKANRASANVLVEPSVAAELAREGDLSRDLHVVTATNLDNGRHSDDPGDAAATTANAAHPPSALDAVDFVVTLGGDGTILHASSLFSQQVPPIVSFSLGSLGFLLPFDFHDHDAVLSRVFEGNVPIMDRMRFGCTVRPNASQTVRFEDIQIMNELTVHRGKHAQLTAIDVFVGNTFLTDVVADGLIVSTPTGSTAYSLSAGGPIVHPSVKALILTPICPRSLSFRPIVLPADADINIQLSTSARGFAEVTADGRDIYLLEHGHQVQVRPSMFSIPCVSRVSGGIDWGDDIKHTLRWNQRFLDAANRLTH